MSVATKKRKLTVAVVGNPNTGKSTLFSAMVGIRQRVGNYPGVTVEKRIGRYQTDKSMVEMIDLPGLYSLAPRSRDEMVAVNVLLNRLTDCEPVDAIVCVLDATNLERNLYLVSQVLELGLPTVVAVNMLDLLATRHISINLAELSRRLGVPVVGAQANVGRGIDDLRRAIDAAIDAPPPYWPCRFPDAFEEEVAALESWVTEDGRCDALGLARRLTEPQVNRAETGADSQRPSPLRYLAIRLLLDTSGFISQSLHVHNVPAWRERLSAARQRLTESGCRIPGVEPEVRYKCVCELLDGVVSAPDEAPPTASDRLDRVLTHPIWGTAIFALMMIIVFQSIFVGAEPLINGVDIAVSWGGGQVGSLLPEGALRSLLVDGVIGGVGAVLVFLPQIAILFLFIAVLEDCGYIARAAFLMDRIMVRVGLSGRAFIPLLSSFACAVPGIMATRTIDNERDRLTTILVAPLMTCSARLPVYALLIAVFIPNYAYFGGVLRLRGLVLASLYLLGIVAAVGAALVLRKTLLRGRSTAFVMELPSYKWPSPKLVLYRVTERSWLFVRSAGTLILATSIVIWALFYYPRPASVEEPFNQQRQTLLAQLEQSPEASPQRREIEGQLQKIDEEVARAYQRQSLLGRMGHYIEPAVKPLGWDWRIGTAVLASFPAREVVVATLSVMFNLGDAAEAGNTEDSGLRRQLREATWEGSDRPVFTLPVAVAIMVFYALCAQCVATLAVIRRETGTWRWAAFAFTYMTVLAYLGALVSYQLGTWLMG